MKVWRTAFVVWLVIPWTAVLLAACTAIRALPIPDRIENAEISACQSAGEHGTEVCVRAETGKGRPTLSGRTVWRP
jgi:hypothetical protein